MDDKQLMETLLVAEKGMCDLLLHATIESSTADVHTAFASALNEALTAQDTLHQKMAEKGWYPPEQAEQTKVTALKQKYSARA